MDVIWVLDAIESIYALIYALIYLCNCVEERKASLNFPHYFYVNLKL